MSDFKERELSKEFIGSVFEDIMKKFSETKDYELCDKDGEIIYNYEISCEDNFIKYIYPLIEIDKHNANFDNFKVEFVRNYTFVNNWEEEEFLVIIKHKNLCRNKINTGIKIKKIMKEIDLNQIFYKEEKEND